jgi:quinolinate synthase
MNLPMLGAPDAPLMLESIPALQDEVRALAAHSGAVILAHNYQLPEIQDVADYVGDSLGLSQQAARADAATIVFCGVHFMAETASILCPEKQVLIPDPTRLEGQASGRGRGDVRQHDRRGQGRDRLLLHVGQRG